MTRYEMGEKEMPNAKCQMSNVKCQMRDAKMQRCKRCEMLSAAAGGRGKKQNVIDERLTVRRVYKKKGGRREKVKGKKGKTKNDKSSRFY